MNLMIVAAGEHLELDCFLNTFVAGPGFAVAFQAFEPDSCFVGGSFEVENHFEAFELDSDRAYHRAFVVVKDSEACNRFGVVAYFDLVAGKGMDPILTYSFRLLVDHSFHFVDFYLIVQSSSSA